MKIEVKMGAHLCVIYVDFYLRVIYHLFGDASIFFSQVFKILKSVWVSQLVTEMWFSESFLRLRFSFEDLFITLFYLWCKNVVFNKEIGGL